jgi:hypothetical protein
MFVEEDSYMKYELNKIATQIYGAECWGDVLLILYEIDED